jgi:hypothetical protein
MTGLMFCEINVRTAYIPASPRYSSERFHSKQRWHGDLGCPGAEWTAINKLVEQKEGVLPQLEMEKHTC